MFDSIGWGEIVVLGLAALFIFGPERLPDLAREGAAGLKRVRQAVTGVRAQVHDGLGEDLDQLRDLDLRRYHPRTLLRQHLMGDGEGPAPGGEAPALHRRDGRPSRDGNPGSPDRS